MYPSDLIIQFVPRCKHSLSLDVFVTVHHELTILITNFCTLIIIYS